MLQSRLRRTHNPQMGSSSEEEYFREPDEVFWPLEEQSWVEYYDLEMGHYHEDIDFYLGLAGGSGPLLELGCGSGRVSSALANHGAEVVGVDISRYRLAVARKKHRDHFRSLCMDMSALGFTPASFKTILVPYNTLNLLTGRQKIGAVLKECKRVLQANGRMHLQIFTPPSNFCASAASTFQFAILERPGGGKIIKEVRKRYNSSCESLDIDERYRVRPMNGKEPNQDFKANYEITGYSGKKWLDLFSEKGFRIDSLLGGFDGKPYIHGESTEMIVSLSNSTKTI